MSAIGGCNICGHDASRLWSSYKAAAMVCTACLDRGLRSFGFGSIVEGKLTSSSLITELLGSSDLEREIIFWGIERAITLEKN